MKPSNPFSFKAGTGARWVRRALVAVFWVGLWQAVCLITGHEYYLASPWSVLQSLWRLGGQAAFWNSCVQTTGRILLGLFLGAALGCLLGAVTARLAWVEALLQPLLALIKATPVASFILLFLIWFRAPMVPVITTLLMVLPVVWENVKTGLSEIDETFLEMARAFRLHGWKKLRYLTIPAVRPYFRAACQSAVGLGFKAGVAAEVLSNLRGSMGGGIYESKIYLETADLFAWTAAVVLLSLLLEQVVTRLLLWGEKPRNRRKTHE